MNSINNKGFSEILRMVIIVSFIAAIYMTAIYIWQYIETQKRVDYVVAQLNKILEESFQKRQDSMEFGFDSQGGCSNVYVYAFDKKRTNSISADIDIKKLNLTNNQKVWFDIGTKGIKVDFYRGDFLGYLHCNNQLAANLLEHEKIEARSGQVGIMLEDYNLVDEYLEDFNYMATVVLKDVLFVDQNNKEIYIGQYKFDDIDVGWLLE